MAIPSITPGELVAVFKTMAEGLQVIDRQWRYVYVNDTAAAHGRRPVDELLGRTMMSCYPGIETTPMFAQLERAMAGEQIAMENEFRYPDGQTRSFELRVNPCEAGITILSIEITERKNLEKQLRHAQKMEAIGRLAGSIAHDFNNILTVILGHAGVALIDLEDSQLRADLEAIKWAGERASELTKKLLTMSRQTVIEPKVVDLNKLLDDSGRMLHRLIGEDVRLTLHKGREVPRVMADAGQLEQVLMNLVVNARDAMPEGGMLTIETAGVDLDEEYARVHFGVKPGAYAMLIVSDTGCGMDAATQARIFEPFFTTKELGKGTGLGLSTVFGIVKQWGGTVWVYSEVGVGTTFKVYLPQTTEDRVKPVAFIDPRTLVGNETILLTEDQAEVRAITKSILERYGYRVLEARTGEDALEVAERFAGRIDLLLTDIVMPLMNGRELARRLSEARPGVKVLYMSGYTDVAAIQQALLDRGTAYIQKPLAHEALAKRVRQVLEGGG